MTPKAKHPRRPTLRIQRNGFRAEITRSRSAMGNIYHYVIMRNDLPEIVGWGQERSLKEARACVADYIDNKLSRYKTG